MPNSPWRPSRAFGLQPPLDRVADVGGHVLEIGQAVGSAGNALAVVGDAQVVLALLPAADDRDVAGPGVDAVLDELGHRLERVALRQGDDGDGVPVVADLQATRG